MWKPNLNWGLTNLKSIEKLENEITEFKKEVRHIILQISWTNYRFFWGNIGKDGLDLEHCTDVQGTNKIIEWMLWRKINFLFPFCQLVEKPPKKSCESELSEAASQNFHQKNIPALL